MNTPAIVGCGILIMACIIALVIIWNWRNIKAANARALAKAAQASADALKAQPQPK